MYRMGHKGKVDLKYYTDKSGGNYYPTHLPVLGKASGINAFYMCVTANSIIYV